MENFRKNVFKTPLIVINLYKFIDWNTKKIKYKDIYPTLIHEFVHFLQYKEFYKYMHFKITTGNFKGLAVNKPFKFNSSYFKRKQEHAAWGYEFVEYYRNLIDRYKIDPYALINKLRMYGLNNYNNLQDLKKNDYNSWKRIMKHAVAATKNTA